MIRITEDPRCKGHFNRYPALDPHDLRSQLPGAPVHHRPTRQVTPTPVFVARREQVLKVEGNRRIARHHRERPELIRPDSPIHHFIQPRLQIQQGLQKPHGPALRRNRHCKVPGDRIALQPVMHDSANARRKRIPIPNRVRDQEVPHLRIPFPIHHLHQAPPVHAAHKKCVRIPVFMGRLQKVLRPDAHIRLAPHDLHQSRCKLCGNACCLRHRRCAMARPRARIPRHLRTPGPHKPTSPECEQDRFRVRALCFRANFSGGENLPHEANLAMNGSQKCEARVEPSRGGRQVQFPDHA